jgi:hypothetical protein
MEWQKHIFCILGSGPSFLLFLVHIYLFIRQFEPRSFGISRQTATAPVLSLLESRSPLDIL